MKTLVKKALCAGVCSLLTVPAAAGAHARIPRTPLARHALGQATPRHPESSITEVLGRLHHSATASATAHFNAPDAVATDAAGDVYVANEGGNDIEKINTGLTVVKSFKITKDTTAPISLPCEMTSPRAETIINLARTPPT